MFENSENGEGLATAGVTPRQLTPLVFVFRRQREYFHDLFRALSSGFELVAVEAAAAAFSCQNKNRFFSSVGGDVEGEMCCIFSRLRLYKVNLNTLEQPAGFSYIKLSNRSTRGWGGSIVWSLRPGVSEAQPVAHLVHTGEAVSAAGGAVVEGGPGAPPPPLRSPFRRRLGLSASPQWDSCLLFT